MIGRAKTLGASVLALIASGCATLDGADIMAEIETPPSWQAVADAHAGDSAQLTKNWLADLNDARVGALVAEAVAHNQTLAASRARAKAVRERVGIVRAGLLPSVSAFVRGQSDQSTDGFRFNNITNQIEQVPAASADSYGAGLSLSWELDIWGRLTDQTRASYLGADAARLDLAASQLSIAGATAQAYYGLVEAHLQRQLSERDVATGKANLRIIERRYNRGISSSLDVRLARSSLASSNAALINRQRLENEAARRLEVLLGRYPAATINAADSLPDARPLTDGKEGLGSPATLLDYRPDVIASESRMKAAGLDVMAARKALIPSLSLSASAVSPTFQSSEDITFDWENTFRNLTANLVQPVFRGGQLRAQALAAKKDMEAAIADYAQTALVAYREVEDALAAETYLSAQLEAQRLAFDEAKAAEELTNRQYLNGTTNIFNLISAQQRRINSESQYIAAQRAQLVNRIDLYLALGAPFDAAPAQVTTAPEGAGMEGARL